MQQWRQHDSDFDGEQFSRAPCSKKGKRNMPGIISGNVTSNNQPVLNAVITVYDTAAATPPVVVTTNNMGNYATARLADSTYIVQAQAVNDVNSQGRPAYVTIAGADVNNINFALQPPPLVSFSIKVESASNHAPVTTGTVSLVDNAGGVLSGQLGQNGQCPPFTAAPGKYDVFVNGLPPQKPSILAYAGMPNPITIAI